jgi:hypothetical protein
MIMQLNDATQNVVNICKANNLNITGMCRNVEEASFAVYFVKDKKYADIEVFDSGTILAVISDGKSKSDDSLKVW